MSNVFLFFTFRLLYVFILCLISFPNGKACRGTTLDSGTLLVCDSRSADDADQTPPEAPTLRRIPVEADLFIAYAVQPG